MSNAYPVDQLKAFARRALMTAGMAEQPASVVANGLVEADLYGHDTHGLALLPEYVEELEAGVMTTEGEPPALSDLGAVACWDGRRLPGIWVTTLAVDAAIAKAEKNGIGAVAIGRSHHIGCLASYLEKPARAGYAVVIMCSDPSDAHVAPYGGRTPVLTPNPIAAGIPGDPDPVMIDISTSITSRARCARTQAAGKRMPALWLQDKDGHATDDPACLDDGGTILPIGGVDHGHKGFALSLLVELLTQGLAGHGRADQPSEWGASVLVLAMAPSAFASQEAFRRQASWLIAACRSVTPIAPDQSVRVPGMKALAKKADAMTSGCTINPVLAGELDALAARLGLPGIDNSAKR
jgi:L-lactate dehydrogenase